MWKYDQEIQNVPAEQVNRVRMALVGSANDPAVFDGQNGRPENNGNRQIIWWALALPLLALIAIIAIHFLTAPVTARAEGEKSWSDDPVLLAAITMSGRSPDKFPNKGLISGIAYSENRATVFINDKMMSEGGVVDGVTVFKIRADTVEFEKNGKRWTQKAGEQPASWWQ